MDDCIFCKIISKEIPSSQIFSDQQCIAFLDIQPVNPGHVLLIPKKHVAFLAELDEETGAYLFRIAQRIVKALRNSGVRCDGVNLFLADGEAAMQEIFHVHLHIFPRFFGDGFGLHFGPNYLNKPNREMLDEIAEKIRNHL